MTPRERIEAVFAGRRPDRVPVADTLHHAGLIEAVAGREGTVAERAWRAVAKVLDATPEGILTGEARPTRAWNGWTLHCDKWSRWAEPPSPGPREDPVGWLRGLLEHDFDPLADLAEHVGELTQECERVAPAIVWTSIAAPDFYPCSRLTHGPIGLGAAVTLFGLEGLTYLLADEPGLVSEFFELYTDTALARVAALPKELPTRVFFVGEDLAHRGGPLYAPDFLAREFFPRLARIVTAIHARGDFVLYHSDGALEALLPQLVEAGIDGLHPIEVDAGLTVPALRSAFPRLVLVGGIDCIRLLSRGTPEEVGEAVRRLVEVGGERYIAGASGELHEAIPVENGLAMLAALGRDG
ncbi:hypothetical protein HS125_10100 [bacterium]|nr:hypothetical protein [bacterium]